LLPSSLAALVVTAAVIWRMWQLLQDREKARQSLRHHATHDDLTGLPNRRALYELLHARVAVTGDGSGQVAPFALLFLDLDGFKAINDTLGHEAGDAVLIEVAARIRMALRDRDVLTRPSGDEFVAVCDGPIDRALARQIADRIHEQIVAPITVRGVEVAIGASIGVALPPALSGDRTRDADRMMRLADHAMYDAKRAGGRRTVLARAGAVAGRDGDPPAPPITPP
jgi:diguanylate cyclase (GGDEF)-like protein